MAISALARFEHKLATATPENPVVLTERSAAAIWRDAMEQGRMDILARLGEVTGMSLVRQTRSDSGWAKNVEVVTVGENQDPNFADANRSLGHATGAGDQTGSLQVFNTGRGGVVKYGFDGMVNQTHIFGNDIEGHTGERAAVYGTNSRTGEEVLLGYLGNNPTYINRFNGLKPYTKAAGGYIFKAPKGKLFDGIKIVDQSTSGNGVDIDAVHARFKG